MLLKPSAILVLSALTLAIPLHSSYASIRKSKVSAPTSAPAREVYAATEDEVDHLPPPRPLSREQVQSVSKPAPKVQVQTQPQETAPSRRQQPGIAPVAKAAPVAPATHEIFDLVPSDQTDAVTKRLRLVEEIIRKHARAYDYRSHTVRDLEQILSQLDGPVKTKAPAPAPARLPDIESEVQEEEAPLPTPPSG